MIKKFLEESVSTYKDCIGMIRCRFHLLSRRNQCQSAFGQTLFSTVKIQVCHYTKHEVLEPCISKDNQKDLSKETGCSRVA